MPMEYLLLVVGTLICAVLAVQARRLLTAALWLVGVSVLTAILLYMLDAYVMAVIELSLSAGLVTILMVFAITMVGADSPDQPVSRPLNWLLIAAMLLLVIGLTLPLLPLQPTIPETAFATIFWQLRQSDVFTQIAMIFAGVLGLLGLLTESHIKQQNNERFREQMEPDRVVVAAPAELPSDEFEPEKEKV